MQNRPIIIALAAAGILAGAHAGIAAIDNEGMEYAAVPVADAEQGRPAIAEAQAPVESYTTRDALTPPEAQTGAGSQTAMQSGDASVPTSVPMAASGSQTGERTVRVPFTNWHMKVTQPTFPSSFQETADPLPGVVAYFDRKNAGIKLTGAPSPVFPSGAAEISEPLPAVAAYFDRLEASRLASVAPSSPVARNTPATDSTNATPFSAD